MTLLRPTCLAAFLILSGMRPAAGASASEPEDELKAAIVMSFLRYAEWPQPLAAGVPIVVGVAGRSEFAEVLRRTLEGKSANDHAIKVIELKTAADAQGCHVIYFATLRGSEVKQTLEGSRPARVLTLGEAKEFLNWGGDINLLIVDGHMSFEVNRDALERSGVKISSKLLRFGQIRSGGKGGGS
jgi:hypothetical protein